MLAPSPPPRAHAARNGVWTRHFQTAPDRTASSHQTPPGEPAWWRCCQGKRDACLYFTAETTKGTKYHEAEIAQPSCSFVPFVVCLSVPLSLLNRKVAVRIFRPNVIRARANQPVVIKLFDDVRRPAADARESEHRREQVHVQSQRGVSGSRIKVDVGVEVLFIL